MQAIDGTSLNGGNRVFTVRETRFQIPGRAGSISLTLQKSRISKSRDSKRWLLAHHLVWHKWP